MPPQNYDSDDLADYDGDDYDNEEDELSPEDRAAMNNGIAEVRKALASEANKVTAAQIQDALWHYYYDVDKSVAYLTKTFIAPPPKPTPKKTPEGEFGLVSFSATQLLGAGTAGTDHEYCGNPRILSPTANTRGFPVAKVRQPPSSLDFMDMPWLNVPQHRLATFTEPYCPPGGLLGGGEGAPKMSKLQALAAERKKKNEMKKEQEKAAQAEAGLKDLSISDQVPNLKENQPPSSAAKRQKLSDGSSGLSKSLRPVIDKAPQPQPERETAVKAQEYSPASHDQSPETATDMSADKTTPSAFASALFGPPPVIPNRAEPSAFAQTLFGPAPGDGTKRKQDVFAMPYTMSSAYNASVFSEPSPDDVVLAAQAKGSNFARAK
jgi:elongation factor 1 alpha-like protein